LHTYQDFIEPVFRGPLSQFIVGKKILADNNVTALVSLSSVDEYLTDVTCDVEYEEIVCFDLAHLHLTTVIISR
jgi:hypothetical protein